MIKANTWFLKVLHYERNIIALNLKREVLRKPVEQAPSGSLLPNVHE